VLGVSALLLVGFAVLWPGANSVTTVTAAPAGVRPEAAARHTGTTAAGVPRTPAQLIPHPTDSAWRGAEAFRRGDYHGALTAYAMAIAAQPDDTEALNNAALSLERLGRFQEALPLLQRAIQLDPDKWSYRFNLGHLLGRMGDWAGAVAAYHEADRLFTDDYVTLFNLGLALQRLGNDAEAVGPLKRAVELEPGDPSLLLALGKSYQRLGRADALRETLSRFLELAPESPIAPTVQGVVSRLGSAAASARTAPGAQP
jgi:Flp pilus assembly protein TadD